MLNPWIDFDIRKEKNLIHILDRPHIEAFNNLYPKNKSYRIPNHLPPLPYLGDPKARVLVLLANPGLSEQEAKLSYKLSKESLQTSYLNLTHQKLKNDSGKDTTGLFTTLQSPWWFARTRKLIDATSPSKVENGLFFVNYHPYHSKSWKPILFTLPTQHYSFHLVKQAMQRNALILMSRNTEGWITAIPELYHYQNKHKFLSSRSVHISPKNLKPGVFNKIIELI